MPGHPPRSSAPAGEPAVRATAQVRTTAAAIARASSIGGTVGCGCVRDAGPVAELAVVVFAPAEDVAVGAPQAGVAHADGHLGDGAELRSLPRGR